MVAIGGTFYCHENILVARGRTLYCHKNILIARGDLSIATLTIMVGIDGTLFYHKKDGVFYLYAIKKDGLIVYVPKKFDLSSVFKLEKLFSLTLLCPPSL